MGSVMQATTEQFKTVQSPSVEAFMRELGIRWTTKPVSVLDIDLRDSTYQTRVNTRFCGVVAREYAEKMKSGDAFPMPVLRAKANDKYTPVCGRHRCEAFVIAKNGKTVISAYVVDETTPHELLVALSARDNNANGVRQANAESARVAANFLHTMQLPAGVRCHRKRTVSEISKQFGANDSTVYDHYMAKLVIAEMQRVNVLLPDSFPVTALRSLWKWTTSGDWKEIAETVAEHAANAGLKRIISSANAEKVDAATLIKRIRDAAGTSRGLAANARTCRDPASVLREHLYLAMRDFRTLAPPGNLPEELAEDISSLVEAIRLEHKEWKKR